MPEIQVHARDSQERPVCVYCRDELGSNSTALACTECAVPLHWGCWRALQRCPTPGCTGKAKHSDRLSAQLAEWGPVERQAPVELDVEDLVKRPQLYTPPTLPPATKPEAGAPAEAAPLTVSERLAAPERTGVIHDSQYLMSNGAQFGAIAGAMVGMIWPFVTLNHPSAGPAVLGLFVGGFLGVFLGAILGYLQSLVGLKDPQPEGLGLLSVTVTAVVALVCWAAAGLFGAILFGVPVWLLCGRAFGFHPGKSTNDWT